MLYQKPYGVPFCVLSKDYLVKAEGDNQHGEEVNGHEMNIMQANKSKMRCQT